MMRIPQSFVSGSCFIYCNLTGWLVGMSALHSLLNACLRSSSARRRPIEQGHGRTWEGVDILETLHDILQRLDRNNLVLCPCMGDLRFQMALLTWRQSHSSMSAYYHRHRVEGHAHRRMHATERTVGRTLSCL